MLTPGVSAALVAVDRASGRIAILGEDAAAVRFYDANGTFERDGTSGANGYNLQGARAMTFGNAGRLLVASDRSITRILPTTGLADAAFGTNGVVPLPTASLPAGDPIGHFDESTGLQSPFQFLRLVVAPTTGAITIARSYDAEVSGGPATVTSLDVRRFDVDGQAIADGVATIAIGFNRPNASGGVDDSRLGGLDAAAAADGGLTLVARRTQTSTTDGGNRRTTKRYSESQLFHLAPAATTLGTPVDLDNALYGGGSMRLAIDASGTRAYVVGNSRVAAFDAVTLAPVASFNGPSGAVQLSSRAPVSDATVDARGRLLLGTDTRVRAVAGPVDGFGTKAGVATLLADGTLDVAGTAKRDDVTIGYATKKRLVVTINGRSQFFARGDVRGIVVHTGKGNDTIDGHTLAADRGLYVLPGNGNDTILGGAGDDTLEGGAGGIDRFTANAGDDLAFGVDADDVVRGAQRGDALFATHEDPLFA